MENQYKAGKGARYSDEEAQMIGETLEKFRKQNKRLNSELVVKKASDPKSCLHKFFDWDDSLAAQQWRLQQARVLIRHLRVIVEIDGEQIERRAFAHVLVKIKDKEFPEKAYVPVSITDKKSEARVQVIQQAMNELDSWIEKYRHYEELTHVIGTVRQAYMDFYG